MLFLGTTYYEKTNAFYLFEVFVGNMLENSNHFHNISNSFINPQHPVQLLCVTFDSVAIEQSKTLVCFRIQDEFEGRFDSTDHLDFKKFTTVILTRKNDIQNTATRPDARGTRRTAPAPSCPGDGGKRIWL